MPCKITNTQSSAQTLPYPLRGVLAAGQGVVVKMTAAQAEAAVPGLARIFRVEALPDTMTGPFDTAYQDGFPKDVTAASYTPTMADVGVPLRFTNAAGCTITLDVNLPDGASFELWDGTHAAGVTPHTIQPSSGQLYADVGALQNSYSFNRNNGAQVVRKMSGTWYVGQ